MNKSVFNWVLDQVIKDIGLILSLTFLIIITRKLSTSKLPIRLKIWIYIYFTVNVILLLSGTLLEIILFITPSSNQSTTCAIPFKTHKYSAGLVQIALFNFFMDRLYCAFVATPLEINKYGNYIPRIIHFIWFQVSQLLSIWNSSYTPYNVYNEEVSYDGNGVECIFIFPLQPTTTWIGYFMQSSGTIIAEIFVWILFMKRLYQTMVFYTNQPEKYKQNEEFITLMKEQTLIVAIAVFSTILNWTLFTMQIFGFFWITLDYIINASVIFISFRFNRYYFELFKCDKLAIYCCKRMENRIKKNMKIKRMTKDEKYTADIVIKSQETQKKIENDNVTL